MKRLLLLPSFGIALSLHAAPAIVHNVRDSGAAGDGRTVDTAAIQHAIDDCAATGGGTVVLPPGRYLSGSLTLRSHVTFDVEAGATLLASQRPEDYPLVANPWGEGRQEVAPLLFADRAENVTITGRGTIDGQGEVWWQRLWYNTPKHGHHQAVTPEEKREAAIGRRGRPQLIRLVHCRDVVISEVNLLNSPEWNVHPLFCDNVRIEGITIKADPNSPNTDGINPESCRNVQILGCRIDNGDDCVTLKSGINELGRKVGKPDEDITIANCVMYHGHGGVTIGSEMSGGVRNVVVTNCVFQGTDNGIRIKSQRGRGGVVEGLTVSNLVMQDVPHPFMITTFYMGNDRPDQVFPVGEGTPRFRGFLFSNISVRGADDAGAITGLKELPISGLSFEHLQIQSKKAFQIRNARDIAFHDVTIDTDQGSALSLRETSEIDAAGVRTRQPHAGAPVIETLR